MDNYINSYDYKPNFTFFNTGKEKNEDRKLYVGFELEAENKEDIINKDDLAVEISNIVNKKFENQFIYYKRDGSLDDGIEVVSMPFTFDFIKENSQTIKKMLEYMSESGYKSHDTSTCGLHFHINKEYFGETSEEVDENVNKMILFTEYYKDRMKLLSRRSDYSYCRFLSDYVRKDLLDVIRIKKAKFNTDRYMVINIQNSDTIELRVMKGTLKYETFMAMIEFVFSFAKVIKNNEITNISWDDVINYKDNVFLPTYCREREIPNCSEKMKDYSLDYLKEQNKIKNECQKLEREIYKKIYDFLKNNVKNNSFEYDKIVKNMPKSFSNRISRKKIRNNFLKMDLYNDVNRDLAYILVQENRNDFIYHLNHFIAKISFNYNTFEKIINKKELDELLKLEEINDKLKILSREVDD